MELVRQYARIVAHFHPDRFGGKPANVGEAKAKEDSGRCPPIRSERANLPPLRTGPQLPSKAQTDSRPLRARARPPARAASERSRSRCGGPTRDPAVCKSPAGNRW